ncbi:MAG TPA: dual specificity protein phosphatase family protein [Acidimicrobiales bacterium]
MRPVVTLGLKLVAGTAAFLLLGNLAILAASWWAQGTTSAVPVDDVIGISNLTAVDGRVWRGAAPSEEGYRNLAAAGVTTIVDLRAEDGIEADAQLVSELGMRLVSIPIRDGQAPSSDKVEQFLAAARASEGTVFVHCGAGVGRTGAMVGAYLVSQAEAGRGDALRRNLAVGPPSLEQLAFVVGLEAGDIDRPGPLLTAVSRVLDAPRRLWSRLS